MDQQKIMPSHTTGPTLPSVLMLPQYHPCSPIPCVGPHAPVPALQSQCYHPHSPVPMMPSPCSHFHTHISFITLPSPSYHYIATISTLPSQHYNTTFTILTPWHYLHNATIQLLFDTYLLIKIHLKTKMNYIFLHNTTAPTLPSHV